MTLKSLIRILTIIANEERKKFINFNNKYFVIAGCFDNKYNLISYGFNSYIKTHPYQAELAEKVGKKHKIYLHAEIDALVKAKQPAFGIIILRFNSKGDFCISKPCSICKEAILKAEIKKIIYFEKELKIVKQLD